MIFSLALDPYFAVNFLPSQIVVRALENSRLEQVRHLAFEMGGILGGPEPVLIVGGDEHKGARRYGRHALVGLYGSFAF